MNSILTTAPAFETQAPAFETQPPSNFGSWFKTSVAGHLITAVFCTVLGFVGSWYATRADVVEHERRIAVLEAKTVRQEELTALLTGINEHLKSIDAAVRDLTAAMIHSSSSR